MTRFSPALALACALLSACATKPPVKTDVDAKASFSSYKTFALRDGKLVKDGAVRPGVAGVGNTIDSALLTELSQKGLRPSWKNPDLIVTYTAGARTPEELRKATGVAWYDVPLEKVWAGAYHQGTLVVDVIDTDTHRLVYRSIAKADEKDLRDPEFVQRTVERALAQYLPPFA
jgi:hypothetical protein